MKIFEKKKKEELTKKKPKKEKKYAVKHVGDFVIDNASMQARFRDIPWFNALAFQADRNDLMGVVYLGADGKQLPVTHLKVCFRQSVDMQKRLEKPTQSADKE